jgi:hypothetical protein
MMQFQMLQFEQIVTPCFNTTNALILRQNRFESPVHSPRQQGVFLPLLGL